jgi:FkbM family methyltransferase
MPSRTMVRVVRCLQAVKQQVTHLVEDFRLFVHRANKGVLLRQERMKDVSLLVRAEESVGRGIYCFGEYEPADSSFMVSQMRPSDICLDVGANVGFYTVLLAKKAVAGQVHAFEPVPLNYHILATNVLANNLQNVVTNQCAVGDAEGKADFSISQDSAFSSLIDTGRHPRLVETRVPVLTLDSYCEKRELPRVDVMKVDVEGAESKVVRGAIRLLKDPLRRPRIVMLELYDPMLQKYQTSIDQVVLMMKDCDYRPFVAKNHGLTGLLREDYNRFYNVLFLLADRHHRSV